MTQLVLASTLYGAATVVAAIEAGQLDGDERRVLVIANTTPIPELTAAVDELPGFDVMRHHFDAVHSYNCAIAPFHPSLWAPRRDDAEVVERHLRALWELGDEALELVVESIQVAPARTLASVFGSSRITVYADGLMTYGPTRTNIGPWIGDRVRRVVHPDLIAGLRPVLLREYSTPSTAFDPDVLRGVLERTIQSIDVRTMPTSEAGDPPVLVLGQFLSALGVLSSDEEHELHRRMIVAAVAASATTVWFKPHPHAPAQMVDDLVRSVAPGTQLGVVPATIPAEAVLALVRPRFVVGCFSTALVTAVRMYGIPGATVGTDLLLEALRPYENSNRIPVTIAGAVLPDLELEQAPPRLVDLSSPTVATALQPLVDTVAYCMQPTLLAGLAEAAASWLIGNVDGPSQRYFKRRRLTSLALPGGAIIPPWIRATHPVRARGARVARKSKRVVRKLRRVIREARMV